MLKGVNVIKKEEIVNTYVKGRFWFYWIVLQVLFVLGTCVTVLLGMPIYVSLLFLFLLPISFFGGFFLPEFTTRFDEKVHTGRYRYIVNIAPEVSYTELTELYDVTNNNDGTYTLEEKERERKEGKGRK